MGVALLCFACACALAVTADLNQIDSKALPPPHRMAARAPCPPCLPLSSGAADDQQSSSRARFDKRAKRVGRPRRLSSLQ